jgi:hypothetical protein
LRSAAGGGWLGCGVVDDGASRGSLGELIHPGNPSIHEGRGCTQLAPALRRGRDNSFSEDSS